MPTIYVYSNEKLGNNGDQFAAALMDQHTGSDNNECQAWFAANYDANDYSASYTAPTDSVAQ